MRIMLLLDRYLPNPLSSAKLMQDLALEMSELGHTVTVVTTDDKLPSRVDISNEGPVTVVRVKGGKIRHPSKIVRTINETCLSRIIWRSAKPFFETHPCDLVVYYSPTIFWSGLVNKLKARNGCRSYLVLRDIFPQWALEAGLLSRYGPAYWYFRFQAMRLYRTADVIGVQSPGTMDYFLASARKGKAKLEVLFNWTNIQNPPGSDSGLRRRLGLENKIIFVYGGNLGVAQDIDNLLRLAQNVSNEKDIFFLLVGDGGESERIGREIEQRGMKNILLLPAVSQSEFLQVIAECDVGLISLRRDLKTPNFPGKMLSYMQLLKPMLASINASNDFSTIVRNHDAGLVCINGEDEEFRQHALTLAKNPDLRTRMGANGYRLLEETFNVKTAARQILSHFSKN